MHDARICLEFHPAEEFAASAYLYGCFAAGVTIAVMFAWLMVRPVFSYL